jgi:hypothetical protein
LPECIRCLVVDDDLTDHSLSWNDDGDIGISKSHALKIIVIENLFSPEEFVDPKFSDELEEDIASECSKFGKLSQLANCTCQIKTLVFATVS